MSDSEKEREEAMNDAIERGNIVLKNYRDQYSGHAMQERSDISDHRSFVEQYDEALPYIYPQS